MGGGGKVENSGNMWLTRTVVYRHLTLLLSTIYYTIAVVRFNAGSAVAQFSYRLAFLSAAITYGIVVFKAYRAKTQRGQAGNPQQQVLSLLGDENVQYLGK